jgi:methionyl aminopeptidase
VIIIKSDPAIKLMREAGKITYGALQAAIEAVAPGVTTDHIDKVAHDFIVRHGAVPSFLNYGGFPKSICISLNEVVIHGIPDDRIIKEGDIVSLDVGAKYKGYNGDCARTVAAGEIPDNAKRLIEVTKQSFFEGLKMCRPGFRVSDISHAIGSYCESFGYGVVREFTGHGVGRDLHESPEIPNFGEPGRGYRLKPGMTLAIEPMINEGKRDVYVLSDGWTVVTRDKKLSAHYENTVLVRDGEPEILTGP